MKRHHSQNIWGSSCLPGGSGHGHLQNFCSTRTGVTSDGFHCGGRCHTHPKPLWKKVH